MPSFRWKGRTTHGQEMQGETTGPSKEQVVSQLRARGVMVTSVTEQAGSGSSDLEVARSVAPRSQSVSEILEKGRAQSPRRFRALLIAGAFFAAAFAVGFMAPIVVYRCERNADGSSACTLSERDLGILLLREQALNEVAAVAVESRSEVTSTRTGSDEVTSFSRLVLSNRRGMSIRPSTWDQSGGRAGLRQAIGASTDAMRADIERFLESPAPGSITRWQGQWTPLLVAAAPFLIGLLMLALVLLSFSRRVTEATYTSVGRLAAVADSRRRRRQ